MGKKKREREKRTPESPPSTGDLISMRVQREREWAYGMWLAGWPFPMMRAQANRSPDEGGLGYDLSVVALRNLVQAHRLEQGTLVGDRDALIERQQVELEEQRLRAKASVARAAELQVIDDKAEKLLLEIQQREAKLHGLDAAARIEADVTHHDGVTRELEAMLEEAGVPIDLTEPKRS